MPASNLPLKNVQAQTKNRSSFCGFLFALP
jgi:hypothetical protein